MSAWLVLVITVVGIDCFLAGFLWYQVRRQNRACEGLGNILHRQMKTMEMAYESGDMERFKDAQEHARFIVGIAR